MILARDVRVPAFRDTIRQEMADAMMIPLYRVNVTKVDANDGERTGDADADADVDGCGCGCI